MKGVKVGRLMCCFAFTAFLALVSIMMPLSCSAGMVIGPTESVGDTIPGAQSREEPYFGMTYMELQQLSDSWPMFRHDLNHTGYSTSQVPNHPSVHWTFHAVNGFESSPVVEYGMVFIGSEDHNLYALDEDTGELVWNFTTGYYVRSTPAVVEEKVFVGSSDGKFYALDAYDGSLIWVFERPSIEGDRTWYDSSPAVDTVEGRVYIGAHVRNNKSGEVHQEFFCLNMATGELLWNVVEEYGTIQVSSPAISGNAIFISLGEKMLSLDKMTGQQLWEFPSEMSHSSPTVANGTVFIQSMVAGTFYALDMYTGSLKWKHDQPDLGGWVNPSPAYHNGVVFVGSWDFGVYAFDAGTGKVLWKYETGSVVASSLAVADGKTVITSMDGFLYVLDESNGSLLWKYYLGKYPISSPAVSRGRIFVTDDVTAGGDIGTLFAFGSPPRRATLDIDPDTLNLNSNGRWITAYITTENAIAEDIDPSSLLLNDVIPPAWWIIQNDTTLMVKFDRAAVQAILPVSNAVEIKITGQWEDGEAFELHDVIRVIDVGGHMESPLVIHSREHFYSTSEKDTPPMQGNLPSVPDITLRMGPYVGGVFAPEREEWADASFVELMAVGNTLKYAHPVPRTLI